MKRLVIFDLDGTLLNTIADLAMSTNYALRCCGFPEHEVQEYLYFVGNGITKLFERALPEASRSAENIARMRTCFLEYYTEHNTDCTRPYDGIAQLLATLSAHGVKVAVASNKYQAGTEKLIRYFFPEVPFVAVLGQREGVPVKPAPDIVYNIMQRAGVEKADTLYVGDSDVDMCTARAAGVESAGVTWGFRGRDELSRAGACHLVDTPDALLPLCGIEA
ncbi:HAD family hydrolase [Barnesiella viscericola]|uniref:HAD family hydrolase n=1 Tax=Barnesiella viscericola TaxID=397865 RepID=UPI002354476E|nr:HAD family hydrolase [Barnesiella viscericola]